MKNGIQKQIKQNPKSLRFKRVTVAILGIFVNVLLAFLMNKFGLPLYFATLGTIGVAAITGYLFPAICTAVATNTICTFFYEPSIYLSFFNALIGIITVAFSLKFSFKKILHVFVYVLIITAISSVSVTVLQYAINGPNGTDLIAQNARAISSATGTSYLSAFFFTNFLLYLLEKSFSCIIIMILQTVLPKPFIASFKTESKKNHYHDIKHPLHHRITTTFVITSAVLVIVTEIIAVRLYFQNIKAEK